MKANDAKLLFLKLAEEFFEGYNVIFTNQSRKPKPKNPLVTIAPGNVRRPQAENSMLEDGIIKGFYLSRMPIIVDLFTNGKPVQDENNVTYAYSNTAMDEILSFADYLNSPKCVAWCNKHDISILIESEVQDLTGLVNDNNYQFRSRLEVVLFFTQETDTLNGDMGYFSVVAL